MRHKNLPISDLFFLAEDLRRFREENQWGNKIIIKALCRKYAIELSVVELIELEKKLGINK